ncbi:MAG: methyltransferase domain-containing protein [Holosporaceae bacterium]|jgi:malonyl-ACP O-methyltransferase BioC|nr:methyltransferase domain-containing protein [Holosporaceae bacterium]
MKEKITLSFDAASQTYDSVSEVQILSSARLVDMLKDVRPSGHIQTILDVGSGTGNTAAEVMKIYPNAGYTLCDISENMLQKAKLRIKRANYIICDAEKYDFIEKYDLGISNLALQWFESIDRFLEKILKNCRFFAFSTLLDGSFREYDNFLLQHGIFHFNYPSADEIKRICEKRGKLTAWKIESYALQFENSFGLARYFKKLGTAPQSFPKNILPLLNEHKINLNYEVFFTILEARI